VALPDDCATIWSEECQFRFLRLEIAERVRVCRSWRCLLIAQGTPAVMAPGAKMSSQRAAVAIGVVTLAALVVLWGLSAYRLRFGVDLTDESFYVAVPYGIAVGARPLVTEQNVLVVPALLTVPLMRLWVRLLGNTGLVLAMRCGFELMVTAAAAVCAWGLRDATRSRWPALAAFLLIAAVPYSIPSLSYNTISQSLVVVGLMASLACVRPTGGVRWPWLVVAGGALSLAAVAYPPLIPLGFAQMAVLAWYLPRNSRWAGIVVFAVAAAAAAVVVVAQVLPVTGQQVSQFIAFNRAVSDSAGIAGGTSKLHALVDTAAVHVLANAWALIVLVVAAGLARFVDRRWRYLIAALPVVLWFSGSGETAAASLLIIWFIGLTAPIALFFEDRPKATHRLLLVVWAPSVLAGLLTGYTSSGGLPNAGIGMMAAAVVSLALFIGILVPRVGEQVQVTSAAAGAILGLGLFALLLSQQWGFVYRDAPVGQLTAAVPSGPFAGLVTTPERAGELVSLESDLARVLGGGGRLLAYYRFPAAYLFARTPLAAPSAWIDPGLSQSTYGLIAAYYDSSDAARPTAVVVTDNPDAAPAAAGLIRQSRLGGPARLLEQRLGIGSVFAIAVQRSQYSILVRASSP
jgi:hypothetical protein